MSTLSNRRQSFAQEYTFDHNATQAAIRAGYSGRTAKQQGSRLLTYVDVREEIERLQRERWEAEAVDREWVVRQLAELAENAKSESARVRALELIGKSLRMFVEVTETTTVHDVTALQEFTLQELRALKAAMTTDQQVVEAEARVLDEAQMLD